MNQMTHASKDLKKSAATSRISYFWGIWTRYFLCDLVNILHHFYYLTLI